MLKKPKMTEDWTEKEKDNLRSWGSLPPKPKEQAPKVNSNPTTESEAIRLWEATVRWLRRGGRKPTVIPQGYLKEVIRK